MSKNIFSNTYKRKKDQLYPCLSVNSVTFTFLHSFHTKVTLLLSHVGREVATSPWTRPIENLKKGSKVNFRHDTEYEF